MRPSSEKNKKSGQKKRKLGNSKIGLYQVVRSMSTTNSDQGFGIFPSIREGRWRAKDQSGEGCLCLRGGAG